MSTLRHRVSRADLTDEITGDFAVDYADRFCIPIQPGHDAWLADPTRHA